MLFPNHFHLSLLHSGLASSKNIPVLNIQTQLRSMPLFGSLKREPEEQCANLQKMLCSPKSAYELLPVTRL